MENCDWLDRSTEWLAQLPRSTATHLAKGAPGDVFDSVTLPRISLAAYARRLQRALEQCGVEARPCWGVCFVLLARFAAAHPEMVLASTVHRLLLTSLSLAVKVTSEAKVSNAEFAAAGGVLLGNMNSMEAAFLEHIDFRAVVTDTQYRCHAAKPYFVELEGFPASSPPAQPARLPCPPRGGAATAPPRARRVKFAVPLRQDTCGAAASEAGAFRRRFRLFPSQLQKAAGCPAGPAGELAKGECPPLAA